MFCERWHEPKVETIVKRERWHEPKVGTIVKRERWHEPKVETIVKRERGHDPGLERRKALEPVVPSIADKFLYRWRRHGEG